MLTLALELAAAEPLLSSLSMAGASLWASKDCLASSWGRGRYHEGHSASCSWHRVIDFFVSSCKGAKEVGLSSGCPGAFGGILVVHSGTLM